MYVEVCVRIRYPQCIRNVLDFWEGERGGKRGQLWWWQNTIKHLFFLLSKQKRGEWEKESGEECFVYSAFWGYVVCISLRCLDWIDVFDKGRKPNPNRSGWSWVNQSQACSFLSSSQKFCSGCLTGPHLPSRPAQSPNTNFVPPLKTRGKKKRKNKCSTLTKNDNGLLSTEKTPIRSCFVCTIHDPDIANFLYLSNYPAAPVICWGCDCAWSCCAATASGVCL